MLVQFVYLGNNIIFEMPAVSLNDFRTRCLIALWLSCSNAYIMKILLRVWMMNNLSVCCVLLQWLISASLFQSSGIITKRRHPPAHSPGSATAIALLYTLHKFYLNCNRTLLLFNTLHWNSPRRTTMNTPQIMMKGLYQPTLTVQSRRASRSRSNNDTKIRCVLVSIFCRPSLKFSFIVFRMLL